MKIGREKPEETAKLLYGMETVRDWLEKAVRERDRFLEAVNPQERTDHAINFAITASHLEDWVFHLYIQGNREEWPEHQASGRFDSWVRDECPAMLLLADLNNAAKHRVLDRRQSDAEKAEVGVVGYYIEHLPTAKEFIERVRAFSEIVSVRPVVEDDEIQAYDIRTNAHKLSGAEGFRLFIDIANEAVRFWDDFLAKRGL